jgi:predicted lipid-binding transport protein (Tim44 family)
MRKWLFGVLIGLVAVSFTLDAQAGRLSGGKSFGRPSPNLQQRQATPTPPQATPQQAPQAQPGVPSRQPGVPAKPASPWRGALMGLAAGLGLAALAHALGFGDTMATIMTIALLGLLAMTLIGFLMRRRAPPPQPAYPYERAGTMAVYPPQPAEAMPSPLPRTISSIPAPGDLGAEPAAIEAPAAQSAFRPGSAMDEFMRTQAGAKAGLDQPWGVPEDFDADGFLANAKTYFSRLQAAWDQGSLAELEEFTTPDMFIALTHELHARAGKSKSEVVVLDAKLLGIESSNVDHLASVRFTGTMRSEGEPEPFDEVWNLVKPLDDKTGWLLAGIQQLA